MSSNEHEEQEHEEIPHSQLTTPSTPPQLSRSELNKLRLEREEEKRKESKERKRNESRIRMQQRPNPQGLYTQDDQNNDDGDETDIDEDQTGNKNRTDSMDIDTTEGNINNSSSSSSGGSGSGSNRTQMIPPLRRPSSHRRNNPSNTLNSTVSSSSSNSSNRINLKVANASGNEVFFKIKKTTSLRKLMDAYCQRQGLIRGSTRFTFDGKRIDPESTPIDLQMNQGDVIDAMVEQTGGFGMYRFPRNYRQRYQDRKKWKRNQRAFNPLFCSLNIVL